MHEAGCISVCVDELRAERDAIRAEIEARGYNERLGSYTRTFDGDELDASLLTLPLYGYIDGAHPRMRSTCARSMSGSGSDALIYPLSRVGRRPATGRGRVRHHELLGRRVPGARR